MNYNNHYNLKNKHAILGPSRPGWENKTNEELFAMYARSKVPEIGTALHDISRKHIKHKVKLRKGAKEEIRLSLLEDYYISEPVLNTAIEFDSVFDNMANYVNDGIKYNMVPEQELCYCEDVAFGTADCISNLDDILRTKQLRIHDLKTGKTPAHIEQLMKYTALFCLEYNIHPGDLDIELRIYQNNEILYHNPTPPEIVPFMDRIVTGTDYLLGVLYSERG